MKSAKIRSGSLPTILIITLFVFSVLLLVVAGIRSYKKVSEITQENSEIRESLVYISNKLKSGDSAGAITLKDVGGTQVLSIKQVLEGAEYEDCIYCTNGSLYEQLIESGDELAPENGNFITKISALNIKEDSKGLYKITVKTRGGKEKSTYFSLKSEVFLK